LGHDYEDLGSYKATGFACFHTGLLLNSAITVGIAAFNPRGGYMITTASSVGFMQSSILGFAFRELPSALPESGVLQEPFLQAAIAQDNITCQRHYKQKTKTVLLALAAAATGAAMPAVPWLAQIWSLCDTLYGGLLALFVSMGCSLLATAMAAAIGTKTSEPHKVLDRLRGTVLAIGVAGAAGFTASFLR
jgi:hypothetical protein